MKNIKNLLLVLITFTIFISCQKDDPEQEEDIQVYVLKIDGETVTPNTQATAIVKTYTEVGTPGELGFNITNKTNEVIKLRMTIVDVLAGSNGDGMQMCFETCSASINLNQTEVRTIAVGHTTTTPETHIYNGQIGNRDYECTVKINEVNEDETDVSGGDVIYFTYKYIAP